MFRRYGQIIVCEWIIIDYELFLIPNGTHQCNNSLVTKSSNHQWNHAQRNQTKCHYKKSKLLGPRLTISSYWFNWPGFVVVDVTLLVDLADLFKGRNMYVSNFLWLVVSTPVQNVKANVKL